MQPINETTVVLGDIVINTTFNATTNISYNVTVDSRANFTFNTTRACYYDTRLQGKNVSTYSYRLANFTDLRIDIVGACGVYRYIRCSRWASSQIEIGDFTNTVLSNGTIFGPHFV